MQWAGAMFLKGSSKLYPLRKRIRFVEAASCRDWAFFAAGCRSYCESVRPSDQAVRFRLKDGAAAGFARKVNLSISYFSLGLSVPLLIRFTTWMVPLCLSISSSLSQTPSLL